MAAAPPAINLQVAHGKSALELAVPAQSTFGEVKRILSEQTSVVPENLKLFFRGKEKDDAERLDTAGVKNGAKLRSLEVAPKEVSGQVTSLGDEQGVEEAKMDENIAKACEAVSRIRMAVDKLAAKVSDLESGLSGGKKFDEKDFVILAELLMVQLLKLDGVEAEGVARVQRKAEVQRVQKLVETVDALKVRNANPFSDHSTDVLVTTKWETFDTGADGLNMLPDKAPTDQSSSNWETF